ncbi:MAG: MFS transporter [Oscillospiraceae bacterium]|jgi:DHA3 family macrolide efflux protein-like MFS transporter|nr:MFS transporter [Oscillospiraceae bacterium]
MNQPKASGCPVRSWKKQFATIYIGQAFSVLGSAAVHFSIIWWLTAKTEDAVVLTLATIAGFAPFILLGPFAGVLADRMNRKTLMMLADGLVALSSVILGAAFLINPDLPIWFAYIILFLRGIGSTFHTPAMQAAIPLLVPQEMLTKAGGWGQLIASLGNLLGPVLGAALFGIMPIAYIMLVDIFGAVFAIVCLLFVRIPNVPRSGETPHVFADMKLGFRAMRANKPLMAIFPAMMATNILGVPLGSLLPLLVKTYFGGDAMDSSIVELLFAGGMLVTSAVLGVWGGMKKRFLMVSIFVAVMGAASALGVAFPGGLWLFMICCFIVGGCGPFTNVPLMAYLQETTAPDMMGKVMSLIMMCMTLAMPVGLIVAGPVSKVVGVENWFIWSGIALVVCGVICRLATRKYDAVTMKPVVSEPTATNSKT